jgi:hypothetical protein
VEAINSLRINFAKESTVGNMASFSNIDTIENSTTNKLRDSHQLTKSVVSKLESLTYLL